MDPRAVETSSKTSTTLMDHRWLIPVASCDTQGKIDPMSNYGHSIGRKGLMALV